MLNAKHVVVTYVLIGTGKTKSTATMFAIVMVIGSHTAREVAYGVLGILLDQAMRTCATVTDQQPESACDNGS